MMILNYRLTALSRVSVGSGPEVTFSRDAQAVIPGSTVRGALAAAYSREHGFDWTSTELRNLFERHAWFSQAVPGDWDLKGMSYVACKYPKGQACRDAARDIAHDIAAHRKLESRCPHCHGAWQEGKGWGAPERQWYEPDGNHPRTSLVSTIRTQLKDGVAEDENLFTRRALEAATELTGTVRIDDDIAEESLAWLESQHQLRVGGQRSVLGAVRWTAGRADDREEATHELPHRVVLRCQSPMILVDEHGAPTTDPTQALREALWEQVKVVARWVRPTRVAGWHMASGLPKPEEWALAAGSTFVIEGAPPDLARRIVAGVGLRRREGFGTISIETERPSTPQPSQAPERLATREQVQVLVEAPVPSVKPEPAAPVIEPPESSPSPDDPRRRIAGIVKALGASPQITPKAGINGLLAALTQVRLYRQNGNPTSIVRPLIRSAMANPWARALPPATAGQVEELLSEEDPQQLADSHAEVRRLGLKLGYIS